MIAREPIGTPPASEIRWTRAGLRSFEELLQFLSAQEYADPICRAREIRSAIMSLALLPYGCPAVYVRGGIGFRRVVVLRRYLIYYIYFPPRAAGEPGYISIRAVKHGMRRRPFERSGRWPPPRLRPLRGAAVAMLSFGERLDGVPESLDQ